MKEPVVACGKRIGNVAGSILDLAAPPEKVIQAATIRIVFDSKQHMNAR